MKTIDLYKIRSKDYEKNERLHKGSQEPCIRCGQTVDHNKSKWVHLLTSGELTDSQDGNLPNSQGVFPVGPTCANLISKEFVFDNI